MEARELVRTENIKKYYPLKKGPFTKSKGVVKALDGVSISIAEKEILGLEAQAPHSKR